MTPARDWPPEENPAITATALDLPTVPGYLAFTVGASILKEWAFTPMPDQKLIDIAIRHISGRERGLFICSLTGARSWRVLARSMFDNPPLCVAFRTSHPVILKIAGKFASTSGFDERNGQCRFYVCPDSMRDFLAHLGRIFQKSAAAEGVTSSR